MSRSGWWSARSAAAAIARARSAAPSNDPQRNDASIRPSAKRQSGRSSRAWNSVAVSVVTMAATLGSATMSSDRTVRVEDRSDAGATGVGGRRGAHDRGRRNRARRHPPASASRCRVHADAASTSTSRTRAPTSPARSSTGWPARCSCTRCATAGCSDTTVIEASSGSTAVSEAYFARLIGLRVRGGDAGPDVAGEDRADRGAGRPLPPGRGPQRRSTPSRGGWPPSAAGTTSTSSPTPSGPPTGGATTTSPSRSSRRWRWSPPVPTWIVVGAGTGGTSATIGRYVRYRGHPTRLCVPDPEGSAFFDAWCDGDPGCTGAGVADRGHRPAPGRAVVRRPGHRPDGRRARRRVGGDDARGRGGARPPRRPVDRHEPVGRLRAGRRDARPAGPPARS